MKNKSVINQIEISHPQQGQLISSLLELRGNARGFWFFEADAKVEIVDEYFLLLRQSYISAIGEWMTEDWVEFKGSITFRKAEKKKGYVIFHKANPSGLEERAWSDTIIVKFRD